MNWLNLIALIPYVVAGVKAIHQLAPTETKTTIALQALGLADQGAIAALPAADQTIANNLAQLVQQTIEALEPASAPAAPAAGSSGAS